MTATAGESDHHEGLGHEPGPFVWLYYELRTRPQFDLKLRMPLGDGKRITWGAKLVSSVAKQRTGSNSTNPIIPNNLETARLCWHGSR